MNNFTLGPSWLPKVGALLAAIGAALELIPMDAPGAAYVKPYQHFIIAVSAALIGFTSRQNNVTSEQVAATTKHEDTSVPISR